MEEKNYTPVIGLEVHVELKTKSKMFCRCSADYFGKIPNTHTCPTCLGLPGALPVPNQKAIEWCIMIALALNCEINRVSKFDRKNYFYPDLPKGYQISQYDLPFGKNGVLKLSNARSIRIRRVHMEEDTGKLLHETINGERVSLIDFNRSGVPLVEIVTEPDFHNALEVKEYLQKLQQIVRYLDVSNADMEKGDMRLEPNISLSPSKQLKGLPPYKVEVKNINSFRFVERAINFEIERQEKILARGETPLQETRGWNEQKNQTVSQRAKENAMDYRYFPEPDIPPIRLSEQQILNLKSQMPELPDAKYIRFLSQYNLSKYDAEILTRNHEVADYFEESVKIGRQHNLAPKDIASWIINKKPNHKELLPSSLIKQIITAKHIVHVDEAELEKIIKQVLKNNAKAVADFKKGKESVIMFLIGQVMKNFSQKIDPKMVKEKILLWIENQK
jgi:aspartyl-tRNA(Asn)/glutamyl-tRNA(Gln) amidotransferase subunit B